MICPACSGPLVPFGHGYASCEGTDETEGCSAVYIVAGGSYADGWTLVQLECGTQPPPGEGPLYIPTVSRNGDSYTIEHDAIMAARDEREHQIHEFYHADPNCHTSHSNSPRCEPPTVKRATLFDGVVDTYRIETELNGFVATQGALL